jgi:FkbM family methyltransferase
MKFIKQCVKYLLWCSHRIITGRELAKLRVRGGPVKGVWIEFDLRKEGSYWLGTYDDWLLQRLSISHWLKHGQVAWDCGAYIGYYSALFRTLVGEQGKVITFEASSANYQRVARLPKLNDWDNVEVHWLAVGPEHSVIEFVSNLNGASGPYGLSKRYAPGTPLKIEKVPCAGVDELVYERGVAAPDFIKFDLETGEELALHNGKRLFTMKRPLILLELHGDNTVVAAGRFLETYDYVAWDILQICAGTPPLRTLNELQSRSPASSTLFCLPAQRVGEILALSARTADWK